MVPRVLCGVAKSKTRHSTTLEICYQCTNPKCERLLIGWFTRPSSSFGTTFYRVAHLFPQFPEDKEFSEIIKVSYPEFVGIYNEAYAAEQYDLPQICGPGYRKALEFLIKHYLIKRLPEKEQAIKDALLGNCIANFVQNENIKKVASRATWLGNDETHFVRRWDDKDINYLKTLIQLTVSWVDMEEMTAAAETEMPDPKDKKKGKDPAS